MRSPETKKLFEVVQGSIPADDPQILFVGGCVRNSLLGIESDDFDCTTPLEPDELVEILQAADIKVIPTGIDHGTITAILGGYKFEITTLRHDKVTDGRHAQVSFTKDWVEDAKRRDFTVNTLLMDVLGNIYDPLGCALDDIKAQRIVFVGDPAKRIEEDHLRILRFFRFSALYGDKFDEAGLAACQAGAGLIKNLSKERITQEFFQIISCDKPAAVLRVMFENKVLEDFNFSDDDLAFFESFCRFQSQYRLSALSSRLFVFAGMDLSNIKAMEKYILFPKIFLRDMQAMTRLIQGDDLSCDSAVRATVYRFGRAVTAQGLMIALAQDRVMNRYAPIALDIIQKWEIPTFPISGNDLIEKGIKKGPELGQMLETLENYWIDQDFTPNRKALITYDSLEGTSKG